MLSDLGRREDALAAAQEAASLHRTLAAQRPDAFAENLAVSLWVLADCLDASSRQPDALAANAEAITILTPLFQAFPAAIRGRIVPIAQAYLQRCQTLGHDPDEALLAPVVAVLSAMQTKKDAPE